MSRATTSDWRPVVKAAFASRMADCGHRLSRKDNAFVWLHATLVGSNRELETRCVDCQIEGEDYLYQADWPETAHPERERVEYL